MMNPLLFPEFCFEPTSAWKEAQEAQEHEMKMTVCGQGVHI
jgi:hypothetical protein